MTWLALALLHYNVQGQDWAAVYPVVLAEALVLTDEIKMAHYRNSYKKQEGEYEDSAGYNHRRGDRVWNRTFW